jgi:hypothetical protein
VATVPTLVVTVRLLTVPDGRHDVLNAANHRGVAASVVLWLEQLRQRGIPPAYPD